MFNAALFEFAKHTETGVAVPVAGDDTGTPASGKDLRHFSGADTAVEKLGGAEYDAQFAFGDAFILK